jgi:carbon-monoxide dehydrogenase medium subunit
LPILNCAVKVILQGDLIQRAVIALAPVAPRPCRASRAELLLAGRPPSDALFAEVGRMAQQESQPRSSIMRASREYRMAIIPALVRDALWTATHRALRSVKDPDFAAD